MKKLVLLLAVVFGVSFVSCGNAEQAASVSDSDTVVVEDTAAVDTAAAAVVDSAAADTTAAPVAE